MRRIQGRKSLGKTAREWAALEAAKAITFSEAAERYIAAHSGNWRNEKHVGQWRATIATYAEPVFGKLPVQAVDTGLVLSVLEADLEHETGDGKSPARPH